MLSFAITLLISIKVLGEDGVLPVENFMRTTFYTYLYSPVQKKNYTVVLDTFNQVHYYIVLLPYW